MWLHLAKLYGQIVFFAHERLAVTLPGLGFLCRRIKSERILTVMGRKFYFYPGAASMYSLLIAGRFPEPETHIFFSKVLPRIDQKIGFIDVGAAVGEMIIDVAGYDNVDHVIAFEPNPNLAKACRLSAEINGYDKVNVLQKAVADETKVVNSMFNEGKGKSGRISERKSEATSELVCTTLDKEIAGNDLPYMLLIDVEGAEPWVMQGGIHFIRRNLPLIIFEYCAGGSYSLSRITEILGERYEIFRLRRDGCLDDHLENAWNCVGLNKDSLFHSICQSIVVK